MYIYIIYICHATYIPILAFGGWGYMNLNLIGFTKSMWYSA